jgi:hypothetical protein
MIDLDPPAGATELRGFVLDTRLMGTEVLLEHLANGTALPNLPSLRSLEPEIVAALERWNDPDLPEVSPLAALACVVYDLPETAREDALRRLVSETLELARRASPGDELAFRALQLGYLEGPLKLEVAARRLAVSRATFYRLRKKAVRGLVEQLIHLTRTRMEGAA